MAASPRAWKPPERRSRRPAIEAGRPAARVSCAVVAVVEYRYELRRGDELVATGHLSREGALEVGDPLEIGGQVEIVRAVEATFGSGRELRLVVLLPG